ncbi:hypothetical protein FWH09_00780 [Candidatus Saccharibacteria bacterium]|nr:hypothetical protein [Candidatus Saccharibacteria bacterium]
MEENTEKQVEKQVAEPMEIRGKNDDRIVAWSAPEYIHSQKTGFWITIVILAVLILLAISIFFRAWSFTILIGVGIFAAIVHVTSKPRNINYSLSSESLKINDREYKLDTFRGFGVQEDKDKKAFSVVLEPTKKLAGNVIIYFPEGSGEEIVDVLGGILPMDDIKPDLIDRLLGFLHF